MAFLGQDGFVWAIGVVEDRFDPEKQGRVRVRWLGYHTDEKAKILTKDLPWAQVMQPVSNNSMSGVGDSPVNLVEGSWVVGFFRDGLNCQEPVYFGARPPVRHSLDQEVPSFLSCPLQFCLILIE